MIKSKENTQVSFLEAAVLVHGCKYDYTKVLYKDNRTKITITCPIHGDFTQTPIGHLNTQGCHKCTNIRTGSSLRSSLEKFVINANLAHNNLYTYNKTVYVKDDVKVTITCPIHGDFTQTPNSHLRGSGCSQCGALRISLSKKRNTASFIEKASIVHSGKYSYGKVLYKNCNTKVVISCSIHGDFEQAPIDHLQGMGCRKCGIIARLNASRVTTETFIQKAIAAHGDKYDYSKAVYVSSKQKVIITCPTHGDFYKEPSNHLTGQGCPKCSHTNNKLTTETFIQKAIAVHGDKYDYSKSLYVDHRTKVTITCPAHGDFEQLAYKHLDKRGCFRCKESRGEKLISTILDKHGIKYIREHKLPLYNFRYDFYLPDYNVLIEFHGIQHYSLVNFFGGEEGFKQTQFRDKFKRALAKEHRTPLIAINYKHLDIPVSEFERILLRKIIKKEVICV